MKKRHSRIDEKKEVVVKDDERTYSCLLTDMSATGISVTTGHFIPTYKEIHIVMEIAGKSVAMKGSVRWSIDPGTSADNKTKLGIYIIDPPAAFLEYVKTRREK
ncbi:MAG: PilZ domain-containing protein [Candidatus Aminicenantes bacterium]|nr:PilZ domain-containing protein [Acidobacteriota bacterium]MCG2811836.1 PilZ domain-containing protein [Candidatus Aminicenantes bacterium]